ncbi:MAG: arsenate reductase [Planctomycetota bacterium]|jgi:arsenate reductase
MGEVLSWGMSLNSSKTVLLSNPNCSKCCAATSYLQSSGIEYSERRYLLQSLNRAELLELRSLLGRPVVEWTRTKEVEYKELGLNRDAGDEAHIEAILAHPILLERPILIHAGQAAIGRPTENLAALFE